MITLLKCDAAMLLPKSANFELELFAVSRFKIPFSLFSKADDNRDSNRIFCLITFVLLATAIT